MKKLIILIKKPSFHFSLLNISIIIFVICFAIYNLNLSVFYPLTEGDTIPASQLPLNIMTGNGIVFDNYIANAFPRFIPYYFQKLNNHYYSTFPLLSGLLAFPVYFFFYLIMSYRGIDSVSSVKILYDYDLPVEKLSASILTSITVILFFYLIYFISKKKKISFIFAMIYAFATSAFSLTSQHLWTQVASNLFFINSLIFLLLGLESNNKKGIYLWLSLLMSVLGLFSRFTLIYWVFLLGLFVCFYQIKKIKLYGATVVIGVLGLFGYNFLFYNSIFGGYGHYLGEVYRIDLSFKIIERMLGVLISPSRGMLFYATIFIFVFLTPLFFNKIKTLAFKYQIIYYINVVFTLLIVANAAIYPHWWSGHSFGSRFATEAIPSAVMVTYFIYILYKNKSFKVFFWIIIIFSVFIQIIGTYFYTHTKWNAYPNNIDYNEDRLWSFRDNPISRAFIMGPDFTGFWVLKNNIYKETGKYYNWSEVGCSLKKINETNKLGYTLVELQLNNKSKTDWIHRGYPENFDIELLGDFTNMKSGEISNLFIPTINFPEKVGKNEIVRFQAPIILPDSDPYKIRLYLTQSQGYNFDFCYAEFNIHTQNL